MRSVPEWVGKTDDAHVPGDVRLRILLRYNRRCYLTNAPIGPGVDWDLDHIVPLADEGEHRESNLAPALVGPHKAKTAREATERAHVRKLAKAHVGIPPQLARRSIPTRPMPTSPAALARRARTDGRLPQPAARPLCRTMPAIQSREVAHG